MRRELSRLICSLFGGGRGNLTSPYPFTMHIPAVIVMNVSHVSGCAIIWMEGKSSGIPRMKRNWFAAASPHPGSGGHQAMAASLPLAGR